MTRRVDAESLACIKLWEGLRLTAYRDSGGTLTIGYGHIADVRDGMRITERDAEEFLRRDLSQAEAAVNSAVTVPLTDPQFGALVSFVFNVGVSAFRRSTLLRKLNGGDYDAVPAELMRWTKARGRQVPGLVTRRNAEIGLWAKGSHVAPAPVTPAPPRKPVVSAKTAKGVAVGTAATAIVSQMSDLAGPIASIRYALFDLQGWELAVIALVVVVAGLVAWLWARR
jgi:lysozyme